MGNIWEFLYQTLTVSIVAAALLLIKRLLHDKLSPRWQYGVWAVLALRALLPASTARGVVPPLALWVETLKSAVELGLGSAYSGAFEPIRLRHVLPWIDAAPASVTDWLFIAYAAGVLLTLAWYTLRYAHLRALLRRGSAAGAEAQAAVASAAGKYGLQPCQAVAVPGLKTAFVCGVFRPVLAVPAEGAPDEKVILHELLHLKHRDALQNVFWCFLRALHWCDPFMQYVFDRVGNDMESLCDQRVLERLEGEERREYGGILLEMASRAYARAPGTSSISNGAKNIARRIEAIARFKLYPRGMALIAACTAVTLCAALLTGAAADHSDRRLQAPRNEGELVAALSASRLNRCTTLAGALDTYAKALLCGRGVYFAMSTPLSEQERWFQEMREYGASPYSLDHSGTEPFRSVENANDTENVIYFNLRETGDGRYQCCIRLVYSGWLTDGERRERYVLIPVEIWREDGFYVVRETGGREVIDAADWSGCERPMLVRGSAECAGGTVEASIYTTYSTYSTLRGREDADPQAEFTQWWRNYEISYERGSRVFDGAEAQNAAIQYRLLWDDEDIAAVSWEGVDAPSLYPADGGGDSGGFCSAVFSPDEEGMELFSGSGTGGSEAEGPVECPAALAVRLFVNGNVVDELVLELEDAGG